MQVVSSQKITMMWDSCETFAIEKQSELSERIALHLFSCVEGII